MTDSPRQIMRSSIDWRAPVHGDRPKPRKVSGRKRVRLTPEQGKEALELVELRKSLTDKELAKRYGMTVSRFCWDLHCLRRGK